LLALAAWTRWPGAAWLVVAVAATLGWASAARRRGWAASVAAGLLLLAAVAGAWSEHRVRQITSPAEEPGAPSLDDVVERLRDELESLVRSGEETVIRLTAVESNLPDSVLTRELRSVRQATGVTAVAAYDGEARLRAWDGVHRGTIPSRVRRGEVRYAFGERPLFSYVYVTARLPATGGTVVAATLLESDLAGDPGSGDVAFSSRFEESTGLGIRVLRDGGRDDGSVWELRSRGEVLFGIALAEPLQAEWLEEARTRGERAVALLLLLAWGLMGIPSARSTTGVVLTAAVPVALAGVLPLRTILGAEEAFSPAAFLFPGPGGLTLGRILALGSAAAVGLGILLRRKPRWRWGTLVGVGLVAGGFPLFVHLFERGPAPEFLAGSNGSFLLYQGTLAVVLSLVAAVALGLSGVPSRDDDGKSWGGGRPWIPLVALAAALLFSGLGALQVRSAGELSSLFAVLWALPTVLLLRWGARTGGRSLLHLWVGAALLGATCALPHAWADRTEARMAEVENRIARLGTPVDPYIEFLLHRFSTRVDSLATEGAPPVEQLYRGWTESGLAREAVPIWMTFWSPDDRVLEELKIGLAPPRPEVADDLLHEVREEGRAMVRRFERVDAHYAAFVPLPRGEVVSAVVPPRRTVDVGPALAPLFTAEDAVRDELLTLVPLLPDDEPTAPEEVRWLRTDEGWRAERTVEFPEGRYHAHYLVDLSGRTLLVARGSLLTAGHLSVFLLLVGFGRLVVRGRPPPLDGVTRSLRTFQGRLTIALFGFFLLSLSIFGTLAFQNLTGAAARTAAALAERVAEEASDWYGEVQGSMDLLARRVGADLLEYRNGELVGGSITELVELGLYPAWIPYEVHRLLAGREALRVVEPASVGRWEYVVAYRRLPDGDVLAAPVALQAGAAALRRQEIVHLLAFAVLAGGMLSLALALLVGRTLARPIQTLRAASERVGKGELDLELPADRPDEFGAVFEAFNGMVEGLRRARRDLVRTSRRTEAIVEEAATGVVALDARGKVTLGNPRAEQLLGTEIRAGARLPARVEGGGELLEWVSLYFRDGLREASTELQLGQRRIRVRARRIASGRRPGGAVLSLEDVTDELRTERILAWGEMAQQVAHEVKNPLTPIKLSVQHIRRAWEDRRGDFGAILERNVEAILREIDRLASIARSFSRFAAPRAAGDVPLEAVAVDRIVDETLDLYGTGEGQVRFSARIEDDLPPVQGRPGELKEVLVNLLENARAAISDEGEVRVSVEARDGTAELRVVDDGQGIPPELLSRIFEPRFSTRSSGTGLGLPIVRRLVESWGGSVEVESRPGVGTTVRIRIPVWSGA